MIRPTVIALLFAAATASAADVRLALPPEFEKEADVLGVKRKAWQPSREPMSFGAYRVVDHHRGVIRERSGSSPVAPPYVPDPVGVTAESGSASTRFRFALAGPDAVAWTCECVQRAKGEAIAVRGIPIRASGSDVLECALLDTATQKTWKLELTRQADLKSFRIEGEGTLREGESKFSIAAVSQVAGKTRGVGLPVGYEIRDASDAVVGAVEIFSRGAVYLKRDADPSTRSLLAAAAAAILLGPPIDE